MSDERVKLVVAGVVVDGGRVLVAQRRRGAMAGKWEFPGGKVEPGETLEAALVRELSEEFTVTVAVDEKIHEEPFTVDGTAFRLIAFFARHLSGRFVPQDHRRILWLPPEALTAIDLTPADIPVARKVLAHHRQRVGCR